MTFGTMTFGLAPAPDGLRFVQDLVNTALADHAGDPAHDRLTTLPSATEWLTSALGDWSAATGLPAPTIALKPDDPKTLRDLRERLRAELRADALNAASVNRAASVDGHLPGNRAGHAEKPPAAVAEVRPDAGPFFASGDVRLVAGPDGRVHYSPVAADGRGVAALVAAET